MKTFKKLLLVATVCLTHYTAYSQSCSTLNFTQQADIASTCNFMAMTMMHDVLDRPYLYVANKEAGLKIYEISTLSTPVLAATVEINLYDSLHVMNVSQNGNYLYLAIGNSFTNPQEGGMAIVDITNPALPVVTDYYVVPNSSSGGGIVKAEGNYAYLGAMKSGLIILDISDKNNIQFVSQFSPSINFPPLNNPNADLYNARGMEVINSIVYLCFDAGGFRIINCTNKAVPVETGRWCNPVMYTPLDHPKAYNNLVVDDTLVYIAVDYCGLEVLNISDTSNITLHGWWNPYNCPNNNWFSSPVHSNEIQYDSNCKRVFLSTGKSDLMVVDVSNPAQPDSCNFYGGVSNNLGTWGVGIYEDQVYLSYICAIIPFSSNWTGVKILSYTPCTTTVNEEFGYKRITNLYPQPASTEITVELEKNTTVKNPNIVITNVLGQQFKTSYLLTSGKININISDLPNGVYSVYLTSEGKTFVSKFIKS